MLKPMFVERKVSYSASFTFLVGWHTSALSFPPGDIIFAQQECPLNNATSCFLSRITNLSPYEHCLKLNIYIDGYCLKFYLAL